MTNEIKAQVKRLLETVPSLRDSDERLVANVWAKYVDDLTIINAHIFCHLYASKHLPTADAITRARRHLQSKHPELRGASWEARQKKAGETRDKFIELI